MHHSVIDKWSRGRSLLHARDPRVKFLVLLAYLAALATTPHLSPVLAAGYLAVVVAAVLVARLPLAGLLLRAAVVLPFSAVFALASAVEGDTGRAVSLLEKSYLSAAAALLLVAVTPLPRLMRGLEALGIPRFLTLVVQLVYRYLFVLSEQAQHMRLAALSRAGQLGPRRTRLQAASGALATLFVRANARAEGIHEAMLARGFSGSVELLEPLVVRSSDWMLLAAGVVGAGALRWAAL